MKVNISRPPLESIAPGDLLIIPGEMGRKHKTPHLSRRALQNCGMSICSRCTKNFARVLESDRSKTKMFRVTDVDYLSNGSNRPRLVNAPLMTVQRNVSYVRLQDARDSLICQGCDAFVKTLMTKQCFTREMFEGTNTTGHDKLNMFMWHNDMDTYNALNCPGYVCTDIVTDGGKLDPAVQNHFRNIIERSFDTPGDALLGPVTVPVKVITRMLNSGAVLLRADQSDLVENLMEHYVSKEYAARLDAELTEAQQHLKDHVIPMVAKVKKLLVSHRKNWKAALKTRKPAFNHRDFIAAVAEVAKCKPETITW